MSFVMADFVQSVPSPLTFALVSLADLIRATRSVLEVLNWRSGSLYDGYLLVFAWWAVCLFADSVLRYYLPVVTVLVMVYRRTRKCTNKQIVTEQVLASTVSDLSVIPTLLPTLPSLPAIPLRALAILYVPYLLLTTLISLRVIFGLVGTLLLTWRAPPAVIMRRVVWRSAHIRWVAYKSWSFISGVPLPPKSISPQTKTLQSVTSQDGTSPGAKATTLRFLFTIYENQRWWMGLDWTAALLPGERPSWCSSPPALAPLSPPGAFSLPDPTTVYLPHPTDEKKKIKRTAEWYWEEPEWTVLVKKDGGVLSRVERPVPVGTEEGTNTKEGTGSRLFKAASNRFMKEKDRDGKDTSSVHSREESGHGEEVEVVGPGDDMHEPFTDPDGWVYGDNKWENQSNKGGISKYTRFRRWTRVGVLTEFVQVVDASDDTPPPSKRTKPRSSSTMSDPAAHTKGTKRDTSPSTLRRSTLPPMNLSKEGSAPHISTPAAASPVASPEIAKADSSTMNVSGEQVLNVVNTQPTASTPLMSPTSSSAMDAKSPARSSSTTGGSGHGKEEKVDSPLRQRLRNALNK